MAGALFCLTPPEEYRLEANIKSSHLHPSAHHTSASHTSIFSGLTQYQLVKWGIFAGISSTAWGILSCYLLSITRE